MKKEIVKYGLIALVVVLFGLFVYPTMYKYDKYNQKVPVRINRITGEAYLLNPDGWKKAETEAPTVSEMEKFKSEVTAMLEQDRSSLKGEILEEIKTDLQSARESIVADIQNDINTAKQDIQVYKENQKSPNGTFGKGSTSDEVINSMGVPDGIDDYTIREVWHYGSSTVTISNNKVVGWNNYGDNLKIR